ncbi:MAG: MBL fold metallo-hydrolase [archaeon]
MHLLWKKGFVIKDNLELGLDNPVLDTIFSHAHGDHKVKNPVIFSKETGEIIGKQGYSWGEKITYDSFEISMFPSSHVLGAAQFLVENGSSLVFTGDLRFSDSFFFRKPKVLKGDYLIIEATYGRKEFNFPTMEEVFENFKTWVNENLDKSLLCGAYPYGKAQEVVYMLNKLGIVPIVHPEVYKYCELYSKFGYSLKYEYPDCENMKKRFVAVVPPRLLDRSFIKILEKQTNTNVLPAIFTGWALKFRFGMKTFPLSDHADYEQLLNYVSEAKPQEVITHHGFAKDLAKSITEELGIKAKPFEDLKCTFSKM